MKTRHCLICDSADSRVIYKNHRDKFVKFIDNGRIASQWVVCKTCGLVFQNPVFTNNELKRIYSDDYGRLVGYGSNLPTEKFITEKTYRIKRQFEWLKNNLDLKDGANKRLLEIGCSAGFLLNLFKGINWSVEGIEPSSHFADYARRNFSIKIYDGFLGELAIPQGGYDLIIASHLLEHLLEPIDMLGRLADYLKDDGFLFIETPNLKGIWRNLDDQFQSTHIFLPSSNTIRLIIEKSGLQVHRQECRGRIMRCVLKKSAGNPDSGRQGRLKDNYLAIILRLRLQFLSSCFHRAVKNLNKHSD